MSEITRFPNGLVNVGEDHIMGDLILPDPTSINMWYEDFNTWYPNGLLAAFAAAADAVPWPNFLVAQNGSDIVPTTATGQERRGGRLSFVTGNASGNAALLATEMLGFVIGGRDVWFETTFRPRTDVLTQTIQTGLALPPNTNIPSNGLFFYKADGTDEILIQMRSNSVETFSASVGEMEFGEDTVLGYHYDTSERKLTWALNGVLQGSEVLTEGEPIGALQPYFRVVTNAASIVTVDLDDIFVAQSRNPAGGYT